MKTIEFTDEHIKAMESTMIELFGDNDFNNGQEYIICEVEDILGLWFSLHVTPFKNYDGEFYEYKINRICNAALAYENGDEEEVNVTFENKYIFINE